MPRRVKVEMQMDLFSTSHISAQTPRILPPQVRKSVLTFVEEMILQSVAMSRSADDEGKCHHG